MNDTLNPFVSYLDDTVAVRFIPDQTYTYVNIYIE